MQSHWNAKCGKSYYSTFGIIDSFELKETLKDHLVQLPRSEQAHLQLDQVYTGLCWLI